MSEKKVVKKKVVNYKSEAKAEDKQIVKIVVDYTEKNLIQRCKGYNAAGKVVMTFPFYDMKVDNGISELHTGTWKPAREREKWFKANPGERHGK